MCDIIQNICCPFPARDNTIGNQNWATTLVAVFKPVSQFPFDQVAKERGVEEDGEPEYDEEAGDNRQQEQPEPWHLLILNWKLVLWSWCYYSSDDGQEEEPKPEEHVDLLVHHVDGQHAQGVVSLRELVMGHKDTCSLTSIVPETPNFWKLHLVILGKTRDIGSTRSWGLTALAKATTSRP